MHEAEGVNFKVGMLKQPFTGKDVRKISSRQSFGLRYDNPTLDDIIRFVNNLNESEENKKKLINIAKKTPHGSLSNFRHNYRNYIK